ncbi:Mannan endo-1,4-beta-mannosidase 4 [Monoraphidium neglectum]|uniref:mannan endo-1,4-beta-mannosidase n=1 Tax=Monoraphidium neglectum TaxID=145388 RepID=A0A0D2NHE4_9CHLO|nr:Mannan endo-1,4-beta-mannosidase 4 [Monoraphidium neglectum]KIZ04431.1 Mannan endo-1,4-beta-mannosidase 4 [Monoraphidium neglectum]|eukprot:XP_013903450.1 Mannan endo-1,4-beta-mannosidase 4 [Monoraphidium neglectum]
MPAAPGNYSKAELMGLDYTVAACQRRGMRVILSLGNFWAAYKGPEEWVRWARYSGTSANGTGFGVETPGAWAGDVTDFYREPSVRKLYKQHIAFMLGRANTVSRQFYQADPTIYGFDILNEPRCPACADADLAAHGDWMADVSNFTRRIVSSQALVLAGTEGFFLAPAAAPAPVPAPAPASFWPFFGASTPAPAPPAASGLVSENPGGGAGCEGEDLLATTQLPAIGGLTTHMYERQMEAMPELQWTTPGFDVFCSYLDKKLQLYTDLAAGMGKPFIVEEFGLTQRLFNLEQRKVVFAITLRNLVLSKQQNKSFVAAIFWNAVRPGGAANQKAPAPKQPGPAQAEGKGKSGAKAGRRLAHAAAAAAPEAAAAAEAPQAEAVALADDVLDAFRRGPARTQCAHLVADRQWRFSYPGPRIDLPASLAAVALVDTVDIIAEAAALLAQ